MIPYAYFPSKFSWSSLSNFRSSLSNFRPIFHFYYPLKKSGKLLFLKSVFTGYRKWNIGLKWVKYWNTGNCSEGVRSSDKMITICFLRLSKVWNILHHGSVGRVHEKMLLNALIYVFGIFCFSWQNLCFHHFDFFFWWSIKFPQQNINQSETWISGF